jgi:hypothetical protein
MNAPGSIDHFRQNDPNRFIEQLHFTADGEVAEAKAYTLDENRFAEESQYDGFYAVATNLTDEASSIVKVNQRRWEIEECFRIMKHEFVARPCFLSREDRIKAHFMTCFLALIIFRYLEKQLGEGFTIENIISTLRNMNAVKIEGKGYIPTYTRTALTDLLHSTSGFNTSTEIISIAKMRNICKQTKQSKSRKNG